ncbi:glycosyltransferase family 87 protein [Mycolicibacterium sp. Dal123E01]|uniref:glycosyltransferase family 87 protein n=1 Tax=Mycolicibacterium sp. Dal123E01 TaxID=3457578 RepID=UPI00403E5EC1
MGLRSTLAMQSERTLMLGTILIASAISAATGYLLTASYSVDMLGSLLFPSQDCWVDWGINIGRHCFSDYTMVVGAGIGPDGIEANPWEHTHNLPPNYQPSTVGYPAAGWIPQMLFGIPAHWLGVPALGLIGYLVALTLAVMSPAIWAARGARGLECVVVFVALGAAAVPAWAVIDRGNSAGFLVPVALALFIALRRERWGLVTLMVILAALVKPQFAVLAIVLLAARQWRWGGIAIGGIAISNFAAFLLWPRDFPRTIAESIAATMKYNNSFGGITSSQNVSFGKALLLVPDTLKAQAGKIPDDFLAGARGVIGFVVLILVVIALLALGRRIPPVMAGIVLLATSALFPGFAAFYYLVFVLPIAAIIVRDPDGPPGAGIFDRLTANGDRRRTVGVWVGVATALSIAQVAMIVSKPVPVPVFGVHGQIGTTTVIPTTVAFTGILWLIACAVIIVSYARRPALSDAPGAGNATAQPEDESSIPLPSQSNSLTTPQP